MIEYVSHPTETSKARIAQAFTSGAYQFKSDGAKDTQTNQKLESLLKQAFASEDEFKAIVDQYANQPEILYDQNTLSEPIPELQSPEDEGFIHAAENIDISTAAGDIILEGAKYNENGRIESDAGIGILKQSNIRETSTVDFEVSEEGYARESGRIPNFGSASVAAGGGGQPPQNNTNGGGNGGNSGDPQDPKDPKKPDGGNGGGKNEPKLNDQDNSQNSQIFEKNRQHIFRNDEGHLPDTPKNRKLLEDLVSNEKNWLGKDQHGNTWYAQDMPDGTQQWAWTRDGNIRDGGLNKIKRVFNPKTGLSNPNRPRL